MDKIEIDRLRRKREYMVAQHNEYVRKSRFDLSVAEQKAVAYICSLIKPVKDKDRDTIPFQTEYEFEILDYANVCGIAKCGRLYIDTKAVFERLMQRIIQIDTRDGTILLAWLTEAFIPKEAGLVKLILNIKLEPYLHALSSNRTQYALLNILAMRSKYSIRIYELMRSFAFEKEVTYKFDEFKYRLAVNEIKTYNRFCDFKRRVIDPAIEEINHLTDLIITYEVTRKSNIVTHIKFNIREKTLMEMAASQERIYRQIDTKTILEDGDAPIPHFHPEMSELRKQYEEHRAKQKQ